MRRKDIFMNGLNIYPAPEYIKAGGKEVLVVGIHLTPTFTDNIFTVGPEFVPVSDREDYENNRRPRELFYEKTKRFFPNIRLQDLEKDFTGIMAKLDSGEDWLIKRSQKHPNLINLVGIDSPALTSSLAIARYVLKNFF